MKQLYTLLLCILFGFNLSAQIEFTNATFLLNNADISSGVAMGVVDMNGDGLDDIVRLNNARNLVIGYQRADGGQFDHYVTDFSYSSQWSMAVADVNEDGYNDIYVGGSYNRLRILYFDSLGLDTFVVLGDPNVFAQAANFADINNDGAIDLYVCHDDGVSAVYENDGFGNLNYNLSLINTSSTIPSDNSGNYGSVWTDWDSDGDLDMYLSKCRLQVDNNLDGRRVNMLFDNDGSNNYTDIAEAKNIRPLGQSWAADFADIDNDGDLDAFIINHDIISKVYENINNVEFLDITETSGIKDDLENWGVGIQVVFDDFDNDGYVDIMTSGVGGYYLWRNNGDKTFTDSDPFANTTPNFQSIAIGDLNNDGFLDVLGGFANGFNSPSSTKDRMYFNDGNDNNWSKLIIKGTESNINGIGARIEMYANDMKQIREVRAGESYGIMNSFTTHFGIGDATTIDSIVVKWPSGNVDVICNPSINETLYLTEGCKPNCAGISSTYPIEICSGETLEINGLTLTESGQYPSIFETSGGCDSTVTVDLTVVEVGAQIAVLTGEEDLVLFAQPENETYQWYNCETNSIVESETGSTFQPTVSGSYAVIVTADENNCSDTSECFTATITNTLDNIFDFKVDVFPNPTTNNFQISLSEVKAEITIEVYDAIGSLQFTQKANNSNSVFVQLASLPTGIYFIDLTIDGQSGMIQLLKQ